MGLTARHRWPDRSVPGDASDRRRGRRSRKRFGAAPPDSTVPVRFARTNQPPFETARRQSKLGGGRRTARSRARPVVAAIPQNKPAKRHSHSPVLPDERRNPLGTNARPFLTFSTMRTSRLKVFLATASILPPTSELFRQPLPPIRRAPQPEPRHARKRPTTPQPELHQQVTLIGGDALSGQFQAERPGDPPKQRGVRFDRVAS